MKTFTPTVGERFVFYSSLQNSSDIWKRYVYQTASEEYKQKAFQHFQEQWDDGDDSSIFKQSLDLLKRTVDNEKRKEKEFLLRLMQRISKTERKIIQEAINTDDYNKIIEVINTLYLGRESFKNRGEKERDRLKSMQDAILELRDQIEKTGQDTYNFIRNYSTNKDDSEIIREGVRAQYSNPSVSFNQIQRNKDISKFFDKKLEEFFKKRPDLSQLSEKSPELKKVLNFIIIEILLRDNKKETPYWIDFLKEKTEEINTIIANLDNLLLKNSEQSLLKLTSRIYSSSSADILLELSEAERREATLKREAAVLEEKKEDSEKKNLKTIKGQLTKIRNKIIDLKQNLQNNSKNDAELAHSGAVWFDSEIESAILPFIQGGLSNLGTGSNKDDTLSTYLFFQPEKDILSDTHIAELNQLILDYQAILEEIAKDVSMKTANLKKRTEQIISQTKKLDEQIAEKVCEKEKEGKALEEAFVVHGTNKKYSIFDNLTGFSAGVLGLGKNSGSWNRGSSDVVSAISNICYMAEKGGISKLDKEWLIEAAINCASGLIGDDLLLKDPLQKLLSALAGALMFDDAGLIMHEIAQGVEQENTKKLLSIHMYNLNGLYFPLSYVLNQTYEGLKEAKEKTEEIYKGNQVHIINKYRTKKFLPFTEEDWIRESQTAIDKTAVKMTFMAGFLDILNELFPKNN